MPGGSANAYGYCHQDPINRADLSGNYDYTYTWDVGAVSSTNSAASVWNLLTQHANWVFPFSTGGCSHMYAGESCHFHPDGTNDNLHVSFISNRTMSMTLTVDHWTGGDPSGSSITFMVWQQNGQVYLAQHGYAPKANSFVNMIAPLMAHMAWGDMADNVRWLTGVYQPRQLPPAHSLVHEPSWRLDVRLAGVLS